MSTGPKITKLPVVWKNTDSSTPRMTAVGTDAQLEHLERLAYWLDTAFRVPGLGLRFGLDAILDLLPGIGDVLGTLASMYIFQAARRFGVPRITLVRMAINIFIDYLGGLVPFLGAVFDAYWKANIWNVALIKRHLNATPLAARKGRRGDGLFVAGVVIVMVLSMAAIFALVIWTINLLIHLIR
jgi:Domain of unknown function (DUF4112)